MDWDVIAPMVVLVVLILTTGAVAVLRPVAKKLGNLLELMIEERRHRSAREPAGVRELIEALEARLALVEERQDFQDSLLASPRGEPSAVPRSSIPRERARPTS